jgi:hypothetical protein
MTSLRPYRAPDPRWRWPPGAVVLGSAEANQQVWIPHEMRSIHMHLVGASGQGKTKVMESLVRQDILELDGVRRGVVVIDPHGTLVADMLSWIATHQLHRQRCIRVLNPSDPDFVFGLNPVRRRPGIDPAVVASAVTNAVSRVWGGEDPRGMPQLRESMKAIVYTLSELGLTLLEADELTAMDDRIGLRAYAIEKVSHPSIRRFWETIQRLPPAQRDEKLGSAVRRLNEFLLPQAIRRIIGQRNNSINFRQCMDAGEVILIDLSYGEGRISEDEATLLGTLIVSDLFLSCLGRAADSTPTYVYIDECQRYLTQDVANILDQARKFRMHLILAHQHLGHLREAGESIFRSVMTNTRTKVCFGGLDDEDATLLARNLFRGQFDLELPKHRYDKPVVVAQVPHWLLSESASHGVARAEGRADTRGGSESQSRSTTKSQSDTYSESETISESDTISDSDTFSESDSVSAGYSRSRGDTVSSNASRSMNNAASSSWGRGSGSSDSRSEGKGGSETYAISDVGSGERLSSLSTGAAQDRGHSNSTNSSSGRSSGWSAGRSSGTGTASSDGTAETYSNAHSTGVAHTSGRAHTSGIAQTTGWAHSEGIAETEGSTVSTNWSVGTSTTDTLSRTMTRGRSQGLRSVFQTMPSVGYTLEELIHLASVKLGNLGIGEAIVKIGASPAVQIRTLRIQPGWASRKQVDHVKQLIAEASPFVLPILEASRAYQVEREALLIRARQAVSGSRKRLPAPLLKDEGWS